jgi:CysZ protein
MIFSFFQAILAYGKAFRLIKELKLWLYVWIPGLVSVLVGSIIFWLIFKYADNLGDWITSWYSWQGEGIVETIGAILSGLFIALLAFITFKYIILIVVGPLMTPLSEKVEAHLTGKPIDTAFNPVKFLRDVIRGIGLALRNIIWELIFTAVLMLASFVFPVIAPFAAVLLFLIQSYYAGFGNMDYTLERHFNFQESIAFVRQHKGIAIGNGIIFIGLILIGIGFLIAPSFSTVAATIETVKAIEKYKK